MKAFPPGLSALYSRMMEQIENSEDAELYKRILAVVSAVYRPLTLCELESLVDMPDGVSGAFEALADPFVWHLTLFVLGALSVSAWVSMLQAS